MRFSNSLVKVAIKYGLIGFLQYAILFVGIYLARANPLVEIGVFDFLLIPVFVFFALIEYRKANAAKMEYVQGMSLGVSMVLILALTSSIFILIFHYFIDSLLLNNYVQGSIELLISNKEKMIKEMDSSSYEKAYREVRSTTILEIAIDNFLKKSIIGLLLTVMISIILRKSSNQKNGK